MNRISVIEYRGVSVVLLDFTNATDPATTIAEIGEAKRFFAAYPPNGSLRTLTDVTGARYNTAVLEALKDLAAHNKPYVGPAAAVVQTALHRVAMNLAGLFSGRKFRAFASRDEALDWLATQ